MQDLIRLLGDFKGSGLVWREDCFFTVDPGPGYLLAVDPSTGRTVVANGRTCMDWRGVTGLAMDGVGLWVLRENQILQVDLQDMTLLPYLELDGYAEGLALCGGYFWVSVQGEQSLHRYDRQGVRASFPAPGVGIAGLTGQGGDLWVSDQTEQTVYCLDPQTGQVRFSMLTPHEYPAGLTWVDEALYVVYNRTEYTIEEDPNLPAQQDIAQHIQTFIHHLRFEHHGHYTISNGYLVEMVYCEETATLDPVVLENLVWRIALPWDTPRQKVIHLEPIGHPFRQEIEGEQRTAVFEFARLECKEVRFFGWRALLELRGIRYHIAPQDLGYTIPPEIEAGYLDDDDRLAMDTPQVREAARRAVGSQTNPLDKMLAIRDFVYDRLYYYIDRGIAPPDVVLRQGHGSCGEYVGVLLALARLSGIPTRTCGRYKCPPRPDIFNYPLRPRYNHVWIEFYLPGFGWVPAESNADDTGNRPYPRRFFMALPWNHVELDKGTAFERINAQGYSLADLAVNHVQFTLLKELTP
ncbi:transglutaminase-like domain-containing protein [Anthocerotibacter panamensis]|uniref:transglutaminase-like domain-containing protein n=1 Tax=Anthocerotibacter panamensis TaxID=2857077 RepID=UPI001C402F07|nr:transglutaminase family protein [Anthocerotibacter panamensis]